MHILFSTKLYVVIQDVQFVLKTAQLWQGIVQAEH
jgi:hypothetical protein